VREVKEALMDELLGFNNFLKVWKVGRRAGSSRS